MPALQSATDVVVVHKAEQHLQQCKVMLILLVKQCFAHLVRCHRWLPGQRSWSMKQEEPAVQRSGALIQLRSQLERMTWWEV